MTDSDDPTSAAFVPEASVVARPTFAAMPSAEAKAGTVERRDLPGRLRRLRGHVVKGALTAVAPGSLLEDTHPMKTPTEALTDYRRLCLVLRIRQPG
jgi:hypothetical protein